MIEKFVDIHGRYSLQLKIWPHSNEVVFTKRGEMQILSSTILNEYFVFTVYVAHLWFLMQVLGIAYRLYLGIALLTDNHRNNQT